MLPRLQSTASVISIASLRAVHQPANCACASKIMLVHECQGLFLPPELAKRKSLTEVAVPGIVDIHLQLHTINGFI